MIYETRTYRLKPRGVPEFIDKFGKDIKTARACRRFRPSSTPRLGR